MNGQPDFYSSITRGVCDSVPIVTPSQQVARQVLPSEQVMHTCYSTLSCLIMTTTNPCITSRTIWIVIFNVLLLIPTADDDDDQKDRAGKSHASGRQTYIQYCTYIKEADKGQSEIMCICAEHYTTYERALPRLFSVTGMCMNNQKLGEARQPGISYQTITHGASSIRSQLHRWINVYVMTAVALSDTFWFFL